MLHVISGGKVWSRSCSNNNNKKVSDVLMDWSRSFCITLGQFFFSPSFLSVSSRSAKFLIVFFSLCCSAFTLPFFLWSDAAQRKGDHGRGEKETTTYGEAKMHEKQLTRKGNNNKSRKKKKKNT